MSVAFTREEDVEAAAAFLPDRPVSPHPNLVTPQGLDALDAELELARAAWTAARGASDVSADRTAMARAARDLRYYASRRANARLVLWVPGGRIARFGCQVTIEREDGRQQTLRIVGEDEAQPENGAISHVSPLARAVLGKSVGDIGHVAGHNVEIVAIE